MKKALLLSVVIVALLGLLAVPAFAGKKVPTVRPPAARSHVAEARLSWGGYAQVPGVPSWPALSFVGMAGSATVTCNVLSFAGDPEAAKVSASVRDTTGVIGSAEATTDAAGAAILTALPAASGNGVIVVRPVTGTWQYNLWDLTWPAEGTTIDLRPGRLAMEIYRSDYGPFNRWPTAWVELVAEESGQYFVAGSLVTAPSTGNYITNADVVSISLGPATLDACAIYYWSNVGSEVLVAGTGIAPGTLAFDNWGTRVSTDQFDAQAVWLNGWASGKPGTATTLVLERCPAGWANAITAQASYPASAPVKSFGTFTSVGGRYQSKRVTIPGTVKPGYAYTFDAAHISGPLVLATSFQTCTLVASRASISRGGSVRLSGVIPTVGHLGTTPGKAKTLVLYKRTSSAGQPRAWDAAKSGWTKAGTIAADRYGKYRIDQHPTRTTWYVVRYPGDKWYWGAYTSVVKVRVY